MRLPQASPEDGGRGSHEHFTNWSIGCGEKHYAYVAGRCQWFVCHPSERSKPCTHWMTKGDVPCKRCAQKKPVCQLGYLPVWRGTDWRPKFVILYQPEREHVDKLKLHQRVIIFRERDRGSTLTIRPALETEPAFVTTLEHRKWPQDIWFTLLTVWDIPELTSWVASVCEPSDNALSQPQPPVKSDGEPFSPMTAKAVEKYAPPDEPKSESDELFKEAGNRLLSRVRKGEANGNGKHKPR